MTTFVLNLFITAAIILGGILLFIGQPTASDYNLELSKTIFFIILLILIQTFALGKAFERGSFSIIVALLSLNVIVAWTLSIITKHEPLEMNHFLGLSFIVIGTYLILSTKGG